MLRRVSATPCPVPSSTDFTSRRDSIFDATTATNIDFTTDFTPSNLLTGVKPRRRQTILRKEVVIYEDEAPQSTNRGAVLSAGGGTSLLARPAKRLRGSLSITADVQRKTLTDAKLARLPLGGIAEMKQGGLDCTSNAVKTEPSHRCVSILEPKNLKDGLSEPTITLKYRRSGQEQEALAKPPRRGTIYIPPDDTTMPSMYMSIFSPVKGSERLAGTGEEETKVKITGIAAEMAKRRGRRSSLLAEPARRVESTRPVLGTVNENSCTASMNAPRDADRIGAGNGKENLPPGLHRNSVNEPKCSPVSRTSPKNTVRYARTVQRRQTVLGASASAPIESGPVQRKPAWNSGATAKAQNVAAPLIKSMPGFQQSRSEPKLPALQPKAPSRFVLPKVRYEEQPTTHFPPLCEDISNTSMYEDSWLTHQEIAITQLLNNLFSSTSSLEPVDLDVLRFELLAIYQSSPFIRLHKRLHGAILDGTLRVPEKLLVNAKRLQNDLGMRKSYIDLWTRTYYRNALRTALEVVVGRQCPSTVKDIKIFIEVFMIRNEDGSPDNDCKDHAAWSYRRTILRSLMVIKLLDHFKVMPGSLLTAPLFHTSSHHKASAAVVQSLTTLLNPSMGQRALSQLEYVVEQRQHPLDEFDHRVSNLAVDLRDGVRLTRLVELLLYPSASQRLARESPEDSMMTLSMPTGEVLSMLDIEAATRSTRYPLSQHLKLPCEGRAIKLFNIQIALSALQQVRGMRHLVDGISAEDIVDGFREKSVAMLWSLTGKWGLGGLIDWKDVQSEIARFRRRNRDDGSELLDEEELEDLAHSFAGYKTLLKVWSGSVAGSRGLKVNNLTTSFADGRVFEAIVDEYETYLPINRTGSPFSKKRPLHERLADLGCSSQFSSLFAHSTLGNKYQIFDRDFVLAALAFLCSRLLSASKRPRASIVIQRAWRSYSLKVEAHKLKMASMLASQCAEVVTTREKLLRGKMTILKAWRLYKASRKAEEAPNDYHDDTNLGGGDVWLNL